jgi:hypothetical protein
VPRSTIWRHSVVTETRHRRNNSGQIVRRYTDRSGKNHVFLDNGGIFVTVDDPLGTNGTVVQGINNTGRSSDGIPTAIIPITVFLASIGDPSCCGAQIRPQLEVDPKETNRLDRRPIAPPFSTAPGCLRRAAAG